MLIFICERFSSGREQLFSLRSSSVVFIWTFVVNILFIRNKSATRQPFVTHGITLIINAETAESCYEMDGSSLILWILSKYIFLYSFPTV